MTKEEYEQMLEVMWKRTVAEPQNAEAWRGCNEIFMQSQRGLAAENAKDARLMPRSRPASGL